MKHNMKLNNEPFLLIKKGTKTIEMRLYDDKRKLIKVGDIIQFTNNSTNEIIEVEVINLHLFPSFKELYDSFDKITIGYKEDEVANPLDMEMYYKKEDITTNGVVGIEIKEKA